MTIQQLEFPSVKHLVSDVEWQLRVDLAAMYRMVAMMGWDDLIFTHITAKIPDTEHFLINPYGVMFEEVTASSLVKINQAGEKVMESDYDIIPAGFLIHSTVHGARPDAHFVMHTHSINGVAVSAQAEGLLPLSQHSLYVLGSLGYHDYEGIALKDAERETLTRDLGSNQYLMLRNHGLLTTGRSAADAFLAMQKFEAACMIQVRAQAGGGALISIPEAILADAPNQISAGRRGRGPEVIWEPMLRRVARRFPGFDV
ncbi:class II aldolase/adducin family protein [Pantoea sp. Tr-811]|uniref:class II aldolase/adducin family protein n=1 Tax=Pantoea sp. Tr-811 TaxID=2608361 RepID=UPI00141E3814|nr:class II aldolase/adducin family protein [Pantoea sp. Tr-811]NIF30304.1 class II aldolase/adducin family protein [Pantoea sp. Tr-811]